MNAMSVRTLLEPLKVATRTGQLPWEADPTGGALVHLGGNTVNLYARSEPRCSTLRLLDQHNQVVDFANIDPDDQSYGDAKELLDAAMNKAVRRDDVIRDVMKALAQYR